MRRIIVGALLAGVAVAALATPASAHNVLVGTTPSRGASLSTGPSQVKFTFNSPVQRGDDTIVVLGPNGTHWERTPHATVLGDSMWTQVAPLGPAGTYTASYHVISADGHPVTGDITFTLTKAGNGQPVSSASAVSNAGVPVWLWIVVAVVVLGGVLFFALRSTRRTEESRQ
ncbi:MAG TPA: copper resistance CopC family protein [Pseudonocardiaceae bacterium]|nr:copper resistance CopC family protein [Pseudonocardiaceae bacterium]